MAIGAVSDLEGTIGGGVELGCGCGIGCNSGPVIFLLATALLGSTGGINL